jgi:hypothetical protein
MKLINKLLENLNTDLLGLMELGSLHTNREFNILLVPAVTGMKIYKGN